MFSILVYPPRGPGAVSIANSDLNRLRPNRFLNDTLIEFGLKSVARTPIILRARSLIPQVDHERVATEGS